MSQILRWSSTLSLVNPAFLFLALELSFVFNASFCAIIKCEMLAFPPSSLSCILPNSLLHYTMAPKPVSRSSRQPKTPRCVHLPYFTFPKFTHAQVRLKKNPSPPSSMYFVPIQLTLPLPVLLTGRKSICKGQLFLLAFDYHLLGTRSASFKAYR